MILPPAPKSKFANYTNLLISKVIGQQLLGTRKIKILDVGSGFGTIDYFLSKNNNLKITGLDIDPELVKSAQRNYSRENLEFKLITEKKIPFPSQFFNVVVSLGSEPAASLPGMMKEVKKVLKNDGEIYLDFINHHTIYRIPYYFSYKIFKKHFLILLRSLKIAMYKSTDENQSLCHFGLIGLPDFLEDKNELRIISLHYLYSLPNFLTREKWIKLDLLVSKFFGVFLSRSILIKLSK